MEGNKLNEKPRDEYPGVKSADSNRLDMGVMDPGTSLAPGSMFINKTLKRN